MNNTSSTRMNAVKAIVWKEWRERFLLALLAAIALCFYLFQTATNAANDADYGRYTDVWDKTWLPLFLATLLLMALGYLQMSGDMRRDKSAFLTHRPATPALLFWAKVCAGLSLFCFVTVLPYGVFVWWIAQPGRLPAPFDWRLGSAGLVVLSFGILFYFAGALTALRDRPWWGSRVLPLFAALACFFAFIGGREWLQSWLGLGFFSVAAALAAFAYFARRAGHVTKSNLVLASTGAILYFGLFAVAIVAYTLGMALFGGFLTPPQKLTNAYYVTGKGQILRSVVPRFSNGVITEESKVSDLQGRVLARGSEAYYDFVGKSPGVSFSDVAQKIAYMPNMFFGFETFFRKLPSPSNVGERWYFERKNRRIVGYSLSTRLPIGYIGANGFARDAADIKPFADEPVKTYSEDENVILMPHQVYSFAASTRSVRKMIDVTDEITGASRLVWNDVAVLTEKNIFIVSESGKLLFKTTWLRDPNAFSVAIAQTHKRDRFWIRYTPRFETAQSPTTFVEYSPNGQEVNRQVLPTILDYLTDNAVRSSFVFTTLLDAPAKKILTIVQSLFADRRDATSPVMKTSTSAFDSQYRYVYIVNLILSAFAALLAHLRARRYGFKTSTRYTWTIGVLLLGPLGLPLMIALLDWPTREKCASCGKLRVVNRENCEYCGVSFSSPPRDGTEIYDEVEARELVAVA